jgi:hypothetical protein
MNAADGFLFAAGLAFTLAFAFVAIVYFLFYKDD